MPVHGDDVTCHRELDPPDGGAGWQPAILRAGEPRPERGGGGGADIGGDRDGTCKRPRRSPALAPSTRVGCRTDLDGPDLGVARKPRRMAGCVFAVGLGIGRRLATRGGSRLPKSGCVRFGRHLPEVLRRSRSGFVSTCFTQGVERPSGSGEALRHYEDGDGRTAAKSPERYSSRNSKKIEDPAGSDEIPVKRTREIRFFVD